MQAALKRKDVLYDLETFPNIFTFCAVFASGKGMRVFEVSDRKDETEGILEFLRNIIRNEYRMVGFNNLGFDYIIIHYIIEKARNALKEEKKVKLTAKEIYKLSQEIIASYSSDGRFGKTIKESEIIIPQVDLYKIWHFDNKAKATSLKTLEFNMRSDNIEDLPFEVGSELDDKQKDELIRYNKHDVNETLKFYRYSNEALALREELSKIYGFDCTNYNDTKIGKQLFIDSIEKQSPGTCYEITSRGRKIKQTKRDSIAIKDCLFPYIKFNRPEFNAVLQWLKLQIISETKGVFSDILEHKLEDVAKYAAMVVKRKKLSDPENKTNKKYIPSEETIANLKKEQPLGWIEEKELKSPKGAKSYYWCYNVAENLNVLIDGFRYDFGVGGLHGAKKGLIEPKEDELLISYDVASYYPNMAISNQVYPQHLGKTFCKVYKDLYEQRKSQPKGSASNAALKLALNGVYGDSGNEFSPLFDPQYTMTITVSGQMTLCMLIERMIDECDAEIIMCNTDGFEFIVKKDQDDKVKEIVKDWEQLTGLVLEGLYYSKMLIRDVNSYIAVKGFLKEPDSSTDLEVLLNAIKSGKVKTKGAFEVLPFDKLGWSKNHSSMVIPAAATGHLLGLYDYEEFIRSHEDKFDFCLRTKVPRNSKLVLVQDDEDIRQQNNCRYYASKTGGKLVKLMPSLVEGADVRRLGIDTEWNVKTCNNINDFNWKDLDYSYYITEAKKLIDMVELVTE